jgi:hypothetical protein
MRLELAAAQAQVAVFKKSRRIMSSIIETPHTLAKN